jgi:hypothetical protein
MRSLLVAILTMAFVSISTSISAQAPDPLSFQGYVTDLGSTPLSNPSIPMTFKLYEGSSLVWTEIHTSVEIVEGIFNVLLGSVTPLNTVRFNRSLSLGIQVGATAEISPRTPLAAAAYAKALPGMYTFYRNDGNGDKSYNVVGGGTNNIVGSNVAGATIGGGGGFEDSDSEPNRVLANFTTVSGGYNNEASSKLATVSGGNGNTASGYGSAIGGGGSNTASGSRAAIGGGSGNIAGGRHATIPGGSSNRAMKGFTLAAGHKAQANHSGSFVWADSASQFGEIFASSGVNQFLIRAAGGVVIGANSPRGMLTLRGPDERIMGPTLVFLGNAGNQVEAGRIRFMDGVSATNHRGAYIHYDGLGNRLHIGVHDGTDVVEANDIDIITIERATGDVGIKRDNPSYSLQVGTTTSDGNGAHVTDGGAWVSGSSRTFKENLRPVSSSRVLQEVLDLPVYRWRYKGSDEGEHMGPVAEDFFQAFELGDDERYISALDGDGVALAAIQGLYELVQELQAENKQMRAAMARAGIE